MMGDIAANPIVTVPSDVKPLGGEKPMQAFVGTPPPVKGRCHISVQTDAETSTESGGDEQQKFIAQEGIASLWS